MPRVPDPTVVLATMQQSSDEWLSAASVAERVSAQSQARTMSVTASLDALRQLSNDGFVETRMSGTRLEFKAVTP